MRTSAVTFMDRTCPHSKLLEVFGFGSCINSIVLNANKMWSSRDENWHLQPWGQHFLLFKGWKPLVVGFLPSQTVYMPLESVHKWKRDEGWKITNRSGRHLQPSTLFWPIGVNRKLSWVRLRCTSQLLFLKCRNVRLCGCLSTAVVPQHRVLW